MFLFCSPTDNCVCVLLLCREAVVHKASEQMELNANWLQTVVLLEVCTEIVFNIATEMFQITVMARLRRLGDCCKNFELQRLFRYWMVWRKVSVVASFGQIMGTLCCGDGLDS